jgi:hypothetical protein
MHKDQVFGHEVDRCTVYEDWEKTMQGAVICTLSDNVFLLRMKRDSYNRKYYEAVQYVGPAENASKYRYEHHLVSPDGDKEITVKGTVRSDAESMVGMIRSGACFVIDYDVAKAFVCRNGLIAWRVTITTRDK